MKQPLAILGIAALALAAQDYPPDQPKNLWVPTSTSTRPVGLRARSMEREPSYPGTVHLKGDVEIKTPVCIAQPTGQVCAGYVVVRADEADFHEDSGQIDARGKVTVTREK